MTWILAFIYFYEAEPYVIKYGTYESMNDCFFAREALGQEQSGQVGYFPPVQQAISNKNCFWRTSL